MKFKKFMLNIGIAILPTLTLSTVSCNFNYKSQDINVSPYPNHEDAFPEPPIIKMPQSSEESGRNSGEKDFFGNKWQSKLPLVTPGENETQEELPKPSNSPITQTPIEPKTRISDPNPKVVKHDYKINNTVLEGLLKSNKYGYSPKALASAIEDKQQEKIDINFLRQLLSAPKDSEVQWGDLTSLKFTADDDAGTLKIDFKIGEQKISSTLTPENGLLKTTDFYDHIKKLTFNLDVAHESVALAATSNGGGNPYESVETTSDGLIFNDLKFKTGARYTGTAWVLDRIIRPNDSESETLSYLVGTNIHVGSFANAFFEKYGQNKEKYVALDPLNIDFGWRRNLIGKNHNGFDGNITKPTDNVNPITNLKFGRDNLFKGRFNQTAEKYILDRRQEKIRSWYHRPTRDMELQKQNLLNSLLFSPKHETLVNNLQYNSLGADFMVIRMDLRKKDLQNQWPELYQAFVEKSENNLFLKINTKRALDPKKEDFYIGGYPGYGGIFNSAADQKIYQDEGYNEKKHQQGNFWRAAKLSIFEYPGKATANLTHEEGLDPTSYKFTAKKNIKGIDSSIKGIDEIESLYYIDNYNKEDFQKIWGNRVNINGPIANNEIRDIEIRQKAAWSISERELNIRLKPLLRKIYTTAKRHLATSSEYVKSGASGSMVINANKEIVGIAASIVPDYVVKGWKNVIFYDFYNTYDKIEGNKIYGLDILEKLREANLETVIINPKK